MRGLAKAIPSDTKDSLNQNPAFQWFVMGLVVLVGAFLVYRGVQAVKTKHLVGKRGRVFEGTTAQALGVLYAGIGVAMVVVPIVSLFVR